MLTDGERAALKARARKRTASQALAERARIVLACAEEGAVEEAVVGSEVGCAVTRGGRAIRGVAGDGPHVAGRGSWSGG